MKENRNIIGRNSGFMFPLSPHIASEASLDIKYAIRIAITVAHRANQDNSAYLLEQSMRDESLGIVPRHI